jgi:hypothetical protein
MKCLEIIEQDLRRIILTYSPYEDVLTEEEKTTLRKVDECLLILNSEAPGDAKIPAAMKNSA